VTDAVQIELIRALAVIPASIGSVAAAWFSYKSSVHSKEASVSAKTIETQTDGLTDKLNRLTAKSSHAEGVLDEKTRAQAELVDVEPTRGK
jgi:hypothetical protein